MSQLFQLITAASTPTGFTQVSNSASPVPSFVTASAAAATPTPVSTPTTTTNGNPVTPTNYLGFVLNPVGYFGYNTSVAATSPTSNVFNNSTVTTPSTPSSNFSQLPTFLTASVQYAAPVVPTTPAVSSNTSTTPVTNNPTQSVLTDPTPTPPPSTTPTVPFVSGNATTPTPTVQTGNYNVGNTPSPDLGLGYYEEWDIFQGRNNNCWLISPFKTLDTNPELRSKTSQMFQPDGLGGYLVNTYQGQQVWIPPQLFVTNPQTGRTNIRGTTVNGPLWAQALEYTMGVLLARQMGWQDTWIQQYPDQIQNFLNMGREDNALWLLWGERATLHDFNMSAHRQAYEQKLVQYGNTTTGGSFFIATKNTSLLPPRLWAQYGLVPQHSYSVDEVLMDATGLQPTGLMLSDPLQGRSFYMPMVDVWAIANHGFTLFSDPVS